MKAKKTKIKMKYPFTATIKDFKNKASSKDRENKVIHMKATTRLNKIGECLKSLILDYNCVNLRVKNGDLTIKAYDKCSRTSQQV